MARAPRQTGPRQIPEIIDKRKHIPDETTSIPGMPNETDQIPETPEGRSEIPQTPEAKEINKEVPSVLPENNCVEVAGIKIEIKPTKLKYFRNKTASAYNLLKAIPLTDFLNYDKGVLDQQRDADQILFDFLIAVFDDPEFVRTNYDEMTAGTVETILKIFGRLNGIDEKEEAARKNREAQAKR